MRWCDTTNTVVKWSSEEVVIPYISPIDHEQHRYFVDFTIFVKQKDGTIRKFLVEIKPSNQTKPPKVRKGMSQEKLNEALKTYYVNQAKWEAAAKVAKSWGAEFIVLTERTLLASKG